ncbi:hypothetical protein GWK91_15745 [Virgibacillus sp. MSP4-1]|uniref:hypothetical protein n=1 Tax=Virgibacillus sp. MSP4-1 TaxID=2700081 RepID=UPI00039CC868|nr:hypothetical protein [Virgibacillus sp. MSP4-1]QHS24258.1 hypothetical protein GWK91_15745 [Virgibacillus sp. MSP4-1]
MKDVNILRNTFALIKDNFSKLFGIYLILVAPIYVIDAMIMVAMGVSLAGRESRNTTWYESLISTSTQAPIEEGSIWLTVTGLLGTMVLLPIAYGAVIFAVNHIRNGESFTVPAVIKQALHRFWPIFGSHLLFILMFTGLVIVFLLPVMMFGVLGVIIAILAFIGFAILLGYWLTRWSFYLIKVAFGDHAPAFSKSWDFTEGRVWPLMGFYIVVFLITLVINLLVEFISGFLFGNGILQIFILDITSLFVSLIFFVAYSLVYFEVKVRRGE